MKIFIVVFYFVFIVCMKDWILNVVNEMLMIFKCEIDNGEILVVDKNLNNFNILFI